MKGAVSIEVSLTSICLPEQGLESLSEREPDEIGLKWKTRGNTAPKKSDISFPHGIIKTVFAMDLHLKRGSSALGGLNQHRVVQALERLSIDFHLMGFIFSKDDTKCLWSC